LERVDSCGGWSAIISSTKAAKPKLLWFPVLLLILTHGCSTVIKLRYFCFDFSSRNRLLPPLSADCFCMRHNHPLPCGLRRLSPAPGAQIPFESGWPMPAYFMQGALKKKMTDPCVHLVNFRGTNPPQNIFFLHFFVKYVFGRFSVRGVQKHDTNIFAKSPCRKLSPRKFSENQQKFRCQFFLDFFVLSRF
jgi:hypothetical protein